MSAQAQYKLISDVTEVMRDADVAFETTGGGTRHYVRDLLLPGLEAKGILLIQQSEYNSLLEWVDGIIQRMESKQRGFETTYDDIMDRGALHYLKQVKERLTSLNTK